MIAGTTVLDLGSLRRHKWRGSNVLFGFSRLLLRLLDLSLTSGAVLHSAAGVPLQALFFRFAS
jgi:hypothetical protein